MKSKKTLLLSASLALLSSTLISCGCSTSSKKDSESSIESSDTSEETSEVISTSNEPVPLTVDEMFALTRTATNKLVNLETDMSYTGEVGEIGSISTVQGTFKKENKHFLHEMITKTGEEVTYYEMLKLKNENDSLVYMDFEYDIEYDSLSDNDYEEIYDFEIKRYFKKDDMQGINVFTTMTMLMPEINSSSYLNYNYIIDVGKKNVPEGILYDGSFSAIENEDNVIVTFIHKSGMVGVMEMDGSFELTIDKVESCITNAKMKIEVVTEEQKMLYASSDINYKYSFDEEIFSSELKYGQDKITLHKKGSLDKIENVVLRTEDYSGSGLSGLNITKSTPKKDIFDAFDLALKNSMRFSHYEYFYDEELTQKITDTDSTNPFTEEEFIKFSKYAQSGEIFVRPIWNEEGVKLVSTTTVDVTDVNPALYEVTKGFLKSDNVYDYTENHYWVPGTSLIDIQMRSVSNYLGFHLDDLDTTIKLNGAPVEQDYYIDPINVGEEYKLDINVKVKDENLFAYLTSMIL